ncbi:hypothetical protein [Govanella unica]|uniref:Uncharacterized protein n=1 Tax=Govanella unica TaxID=2975056 RepID=A0A9X3TZQ3_9PROT|nr:hypothetical protein [Govania unica]MDA5194741.1 hypothetical protein [Govania unica]
MNAIRAWPTGWTKTATLAVAITLMMLSQSLADEAPTEPLDAHSALAGLTRVDDDVLANNRGGSAISLGDLGLNIASNKSTVNGNTVSGDVVTGQISANSLNDVSGINSLMFNSGNNVSFQNSMQINIFLK